MNERDESQGTGYGRKRDGRSWKGKGVESRAAGGESMVDEKEGWKARMEGYASWGRIYEKQMKER